MAIDTSTNIFGISISKNKEIIYESSFMFDQSKGKRTYNSDVIIPEIELSLKRSKISLNDVNIFAATSGPGSYTGIRVGLTVIKMFGQIFGKPLFGVSTLKVQSEAVKWNGILCSVIGKESFYVEAYLNEKAKVKKILLDNTYCSLEILRKYLKNAIDKNSLEIKNSLKSNFQPINENVINYFKDCEESKDFINVIDNYPIAFVGQIDNIDIIKKFFPKAFIFDKINNLSLYIHKILTNEDVISGQLTNYNDLNENYVKEYFSKIN